MPITSVEINNFKMLRGSRRHDLPEGLIGFNGPNGAGKTSFINAIAWAFFGSDAMRGISLKQDITNWQEKDCKVIVEFDLDDHHYTCARWQNSSGSTGGANLFRDDEEKPLADGLEPVTTEMSRLLGVDYTGWSISAFAKQDELNGLASLQPQKRMQTVLRLLEIDNITVAVKTIRERANLDRKTLEAKRAALVDMDALEASMNAAYSVRAEADMIARAAQTKMEEAKGAVALIRAERETLNPKRAAYAEYQNRLNRAQQKVMFEEHSLKMARAAATAPLPDSPAEPTPLIVPEHESQEALHARNNAMVEKRGEAEGIRAEIVRAKQQLTAMADPVCPTCHRPYPNAEDAQRAKEALVEEIEERTAAFSKVNEEGKAIKAAYETAYAAFEEARRIEFAAEGQINRYRSDLRTYEIVKAQRDEAAGKVAAAEEALSAAKFEHNKLLDLAPADIEPVFRELLTKEQHAQDELSAMSGEYARYAAQREQATGEINRLVAEKHKAEGKQEDVAALERSVVHYDTAAAELARLKENEIGKVIPSLVETASGLVAEMTGGKYQELLLTPEYEMQYRNVLGDLKGFETLSGGEKRVFALALRLAIADLKPNRLGVLFLDEVIESLDSESGRAEMVWESIESLMGRYHQALVVTHVEQFKERAPTTIRLG